MHERLLQWWIVLGCWLFWQGCIYAQSSIDNQIHVAYTHYENNDFRAAMNATRAISEPSSIGHDSFRVQLAILRYYEHRLNNQRQHAIRVIDSLPLSSFDKMLSPALNAHLRTIESIVSIEANHPERIAQYDSIWSSQQMLTPLEAVQQARISWYKSLVDQRMSSQKLNLELILHLLIENNLSDHPEMLLVLRDLGLLSKNYSDLEQAIGYFTEEKKLYLHYFDSTHVGFGIAEYHIASVYYEMLSFQKSLDHYMVTLRNFQQLNMSNRRMRYLYEAIGDMHFELGNNADAAVYWYRASQNKTIKNRDLLDQQLTLIDSLFHKDKVNRVMKVYEEALIFRQNEYGKQHQLTARCHSYIGRAHFKKNQPQKAAEKYHDALQIFIPELTSNSILSSPDTVTSEVVDIYMLEALIGKSQALLQLYLERTTKDYLNAAFSHVKIAKYALQHMRFNPRSENSQLSLSKLSRRLIETGLAIGYHIAIAGDEDLAKSEAMELMQLSRSFLLQQALQKNKAFDITNVPTTLISHEKELRNKMATYAAKIESEAKRCAESNSDYIDAWKNHLIKLRIEYNELINQISLNYPDFYKLKFENKTASILDIQSNVLHQNERVISYFQGERHLYALTIDADHSRFYQIPYQYNLDQLTDSLQRSISQADYLLAKPQTSKSLFVRTSKSLYAQLFFNDSINLNHIDRLYIIPDLSLHRIPFEVLLTQDDTSSSSYNHLHYLINDVDISYATSFNLLNYSIKKSNTSDENYIGFAPTYNTKKQNAFPDRQLGNLLYNRAEVISAAQYFNGHYFSGQSATKAAFLESIDKGNILHVAAHAVVDNEYPLLSHIVFSPTQSDSILYAYEIYNQSTMADLTVLSACNTGIGKLHAGEGAMSISRAFQFAGCPSLLMTLWSIDDQSSSQIITLFFQYLSEGQSKQQAISSAKRAYLSTADPASAHPFYWAGYILLGNTDPLNMSTIPIKWWYYFLFGAPLFFWLIKHLIKSRRAIS